MAMNLPFSLRLHMDEPAVEPMGNSTMSSNVVRSNGAAASTFDHGGSAAMSLSGGAFLLVWIGSVALHVTGLTAMFFLAFPFARREEPPAEVTRVELVGEVDASSLLPSPSLEQSTQPKSTDLADVRFTPKTFQELSTLALPKKPDLTIIGIGAGGGDFSRYGLTAGGGEAPEFFGLGGSARGARCIVYVVDRSGSMLTTFAEVQVELKRSVSALRRSQKFHVIFFNAGEPLQMPPRRPVSAIRARKEELYGFLQSVEPRGSTDPAPAMRAAFMAEPDVIYFLTDGEFDRDLLPKLDRWNRDRQVRIFTIAYFNRTGAALLEEIAREHGGEFRFVTEHDLP